MCWLNELNKITHCSQRQDGTRDQLDDLAIIADKFGLYAASEFIKSTTPNKETYTNSVWFNELKKIKQCDKSTEDIKPQLAKLRVIANKFGFYDAADYLNPLK